MVVLENVKKEENRIQLNFHFVGVETVGSAVYDIQKGEVIEASYGDKNPLEDIVYGFKYVVDACKMMVEHNRYPATLEYAWY